MSSLANRPRIRNRGTRVAAGFFGFRALVAFAVALLQLVSVLHFTLVPHTFSAALGGVVHVHGGARASAEPKRAPRTPAIAQSSVSCAVDVCPYADAPGGSLPCDPPSVSGAVAFGEARLLAKAEARSASTRRVFLSAPKTSPPA